jgi:hypothetical protein
LKKWLTFQEVNTILLECGFDTKQPEDETIVMRGGDKIREVHFSVRVKDLTRLHAITRTLDVYSNKENLAKTIELKERLVEFIENNK